MAKLLIDKRFLVIGILGLTGGFLLSYTGRKQGVEGTVYRISGNQMPSPGVKPSRGKGVRTMLYFYERTNANQAEPDSRAPFYKTVHSKLVKKTESDSAGHFKIFLRTGSYSVFTKKDSLFYASWSDQHNNIAPVDVLPGKMTRITITIDYDAYY